MTSLSRRDFVAAAALGVVGLRAPRGVPDERDDARDDIADAARPRERSLYVGTYTNDGRSAGIYQLRLDGSSGALRLVGEGAPAVNPSFLTLAPNGRFLYAVNEVAELDGHPSGAVSAFARDRATGALTFLGRAPSGGSAPCYVGTDRRGRFLLVANYGGGSVAVLPLREDGGVGDATCVVRHTGHGADPKRQAAPHAHCILPDPSNRFVLAADLGIDRLLVYRFDDRAGTLAPEPVAQASLAPGAGPRHLAFGNGGRVVYVANELDSTVTSLRYDPRIGALDDARTTNALSALGAPFAQRNAPSEVQLHPSGRFAYVANRGHDSIAVFAVEPPTGALRALQLESTGGSWPRHFALDPDGRFLVVANQKSDSLVVLRVDPKTGRLAPTGQRLELPTPTCVRFA